MKKISPDLQTLYQNLVQRVHARSERPGSVYTNTIKNKDYLYVKYQVGRTRLSKAIGPSEDDQAKVKAERIREQQQLAKEDAGTVSVLKRRRIPAPTTDLGRVLDALSYAGIFNQACLVGTAAYQCYSPMIGYALPVASLMTQDADLATATLAVDEPAEGRTLLDVLQLADSSFRAIPGLRRSAPPSAFKSASGFMVDLITQQRTRNDDTPLPLQNLGAGAAPLQHVSWLINEAVDAVALHGNGVPVRVPQPARYAFHKLIVAQKRHGVERSKRHKDLDQASALIEALKETDPYALTDTHENACQQGRKGWTEPIERSLSELGLSINEEISS